MRKIGKFKTIGEIFKKFAETEAYNLGFEFKETTKKSINRIAQEQEISIENYFDLLKELKTLMRNKYLITLLRYTSIILLHHFHKILLLHLKYLKH